MSILAMALPLVSAPVPGHANPPRPATPPPHGRFAPPPWDRHSPDWLRLDQRLPPDHLARRIDRAVEQLDLAALFAAYAGTGSPAHRPDLLLKVVLFEVHRGRHSPDQWFRDLREHEPCQWLACGLRPARSRLYAWRDRLGPRLYAWHEQVVRRALERGVTAAERASLDGSTLEANASRHKLLNEAALDTRQARLAPAAGPVGPAPPAPAAAAPGPPPPPAPPPPAVPPPTPGWLAPTPAGRQRQRERYRRAREQLAQRQQENRRRPAGKRKPDRDVRVSAGDPEAALGLDKFKVYRPLYNVQLMPDLDSRLILAYDVFAQATDSGTLEPMLGRFTAAAGRPPAQLLADASYATALDLAACDRAGVTLYAPYQENSFTGRKRAARAPAQLPKEAFTWLEDEQTYRCPEGHRLRLEGRENKRRQGEQKLRVSTYRCPAEHCQSCPRQQGCARRPEAGRTVKRSEHEGLVEALRARMQTAEAKELYKLRGQTVELHFADSKAHRGLRRLSGRGRERARIEVGLVVLSHNLLELLAACERPSPAEPPATPERVPG